MSDEKKYGVRQYCSTFFLSFAPRELI